MNAFITSAFNWYRQAWENLRDNFAQIITLAILAIASGSFVLLLFWAFVGQDGETIYLRVAEATAIEVFVWLVALVLTGVVTLTSYNYLKRIRD